MTQIRLAYLVVVTRAVSPPFVLAWNIPGHILFVAIAYQVFRQENPQSIEKVKAMLERHPWCANQWQTNK